MSHSVSVKNREIGLLGICSGLGQKKSGLELGPDYLRNRGLIQLLQKLGYTETDYGNIYPNTSENLWDFKFIKRVAEESKKILRSDKICLSLGGDHSFSMGTIKSTLDIYPEAQVIWIDAHGDMNTPQTSVTGQMHGMPLAALLGYFKNPLVSTAMIDSSNLLLLGQRDLDPAESKFIKESKLSLVTSQQIRSTPEIAYEFIQSWLDCRKNLPVHISFDVDVLDPSEMPSTGTPVGRGIFSKSLKKIIKMILKNNPVIAIDIAEFNPLISKDLSHESSVNAIFEFLDGLLGTKSVFSQCQDNLAISKYDF